MEKDNELKGIGNSLDFGARIYGSREARWMSVDPLVKKYPSISPYAFVANSPLMFIDPDGKRIKGVTKQDAQKFLDDVNTVLSDSKFDKFKALIKLDKSSMVFEKISPADALHTFTNKELNDDDRLLIDMIGAAINSNSEFVVEYINTTDNKVSEKGITTLVNSLKAANSVITNVSDAKQIKELGKQGLNAPFENGSHSFILEGSDIDHPVDRATTAIHEVLGHGSAAANNVLGTPNQENAVKTENLVHRVRGNENQQIDGSTHHQKMDDATALPTQIAP